MHWMPTGVARASPQQAHPSGTCPTPTCRALHVPISVSYKSRVAVEPKPVSVITSSSAWQDGRCFPHPFLAPPHHLCAAAVVKLMPRINPALQYLVSVPICAPLAKSLMQGPAQPRTRYAIDRTSYKHT